MRRSVAAFLTLFVAAGAAGHVAANANAAGNPAPGTSVSAPKASEESAPLTSSIESQQTTAHQLTVAGKVIRYRATAGTLTLRSDDGKPIASMFYVAYVADHDTGGQNKGTTERPLTFLYNGGPGSASLWLNVGGFGPSRAVTAAPQPTGTAPYRFVENDATLLDKTDLVFLDAIGTGYSRALGEAKEAQFWGVDPDVDTFARGITRYIALNDRWNSPKFLFGESYGTTRSAALAYKLHIQDIDLNGIILLSSILNFADLQPGLDQHDINMLPTFAAAAWFHHKTAERPDDLHAFLDQVRAYAGGPYAAALAKGDLLAPEERDTVAAQLSRFTGLSVDFLKLAGLRIDMERFRKELLRNEGKVIGRFDSRFTGPASDTAGHYDPATDDPATAGVSGAYLAAFRHELSHDLAYAPELHYRALYNSIIEPAWDWHHKAPGIDEPLTAPNTALDLAGTLRANPQMRVLSMNGLFDMATPFFGTEYDLSHMLLPSELRRNLTLRYYNSGHMGYTDQTALHEMKRDLDRFYDEATAR
jgi:carboxypeptidase C (cathepsin A)